MAMKWKGLDLNMKLEIMYVCVKLAACQKAK